MVPRIGEAEEKTLQKHLSQWKEENSKKDGKDGGPSVFFYPHPFLSLPPHSYRLVL
jgi:hypothetical protein